MSKQYCSNVGDHPVACNCSKERDELKAENDEVWRTLHGVLDHGPPSAMFSGAWLDLLKRAHKAEDELEKTKHALEETNNGKPSEWAYSILRKERDELKAQLNRVEGYYNETQIEHDKLFDEAVKLKADLQHMTEKFERNSIAAGDYSLQVDELKAELDEQCRLHGLGANREHKLITENARLKEALSYLPKVPTQPYEKELAKEAIRLRAGLTKISDTVDEALLLDEHLADAWGELRAAVVEARQLLKEEE